MEITQFTYFQEIGGIELSPITGEITYGTERIAMYLQGVDNVYDLEWVKGVKYREVFHRNEVEMSEYSLRKSDPKMLLDLEAQVEIHLEGVLGQLQSLDARIRAKDKFDICWRPLR